MTLTLFLLVTGLVILTLGAEFLVRGSSALALRLGISPLVVGLTVVAFGTSSPELAVSVESTLRGNSGIALGNVLGSNIANIGLILGVAALIRPISIQADVLRQQIPFMIAVSVLLWLLLLGGPLELLEGIILCLCLVAFLFFNYRQSSGTAREGAEESAAPGVADPSDALRVRSTPTWLCLLMVAGGLAALIGGGMLLVNNAVEIARIFEVDEAIIGLTIVAVGTSLPELATSIAAALKKEADIAIGNVVGSNIFNILGILGIAALIGPVSGASFSSADYLVMLAFALVLLPFAWTGMSLSRREGALLLAGYVAYMYYVIPGA